MDRLLEQDFDVELRIAGEGDQQEHLASLIRAKGREDRIRLVGYQAQTIPLYEAMDVFVLSSLREGLPNVVLEAMAMEVPVIATRVAGIPRLIQHGSNGLLIDPGSAPRTGRCALKAASKIVRFGHIWPAPAEPPSSRTTALRSGWRKSGPSTIGFSARISLQAIHEQGSTHLMSITLTNRISIRVHTRHTYRTRLPVWADFVRRQGRLQLSYHPAWLSVLEQGLQHEPYVLEAVEGGELRGILPLAFVQSRLFGRFLVSLPYLNYGGIVTDCEETAGHLVDRAIELAARLDTRTLELRQEYDLDHPGFITWQGKKVHMRLDLAGHRRQTLEATRLQGPQPDSQGRKGRAEGRLGW